jgi:hypothetical protein
MRKPVVLLAVVGVLAAGCGGGGGGSAGGTTTAPAAPPLTKAAYQAKLRQIGAEVVKRISAVSGSSQTPQNELDKLVAAFHGVAGRLAQINPPTTVKGLHAQLIKALNDLGNELSAKRDEVGKDPSGLLNALLGAKTVQTLQKLRSEFKAKGYTLNLNP